MGLAATGAPGTPAASPPAAPGSASPTPPAEPGEPQYATREDLQAQSNLIGGLRNELRALSKALENSRQKPAEKTEPGTVHEELSRLKADILADREAARKETQTAAVQSAILAAGIDGDGAEILFDHVMAKHGERIKVEGRSVYHENELGERKPVKDFVADLLKGPRGERFRPAPATSSLPRGSGAPAAGTRRYSEMPQDERLKLPAAQRWELAQGEMKGGA